VVQGRGVKFGVAFAQASNVTRFAAVAYEVGDVIVNGSQRLVVVSVGPSGMVLRTDGRLWPQTELCDRPKPLQAPKNKPWFRQFQKSKW
jgi:hypothetical protein